MQEDEQEYPQPVKDILEAAGVLDVLPFSAEPVIPKDKGLPLPRPLSYEWDNEGERNQCNLRRCIHTF